MRYAISELLRGLRCAPEWTRRGDAALVLARDDGGGAFRVTDRALADLDTPRAPEVTALGYVSIDGERWPVPVGTRDEASFGDVVAAAGWWLAGVQEAATSRRDRHGRFPYDASLQAALAAQHGADAPGTALRPAVDATRRWLAGALRARGVETQPQTWGGGAWAVALTHDLDAVRTRRLRALAGSLRQGRPREALRRALGPDRRRASVGALRALAERHGTRATFLVKPGAWTVEDLPGALDRPTVRRLRAWGAAGHEIGWHPGYGVHGHPARWDAEAERFAAAFGRPPQTARTHFLRWNAETAPALAARGVTLDSTLGFAETPGFRRGTAQPFRLFDRVADGPRDVWEMPLAVMDTTLADHLGLDPDALAGALRQTVDAAQRAGGVAVVLWHNQIGGDTAGWTARLDTLDREIGRARAAGATVGPMGALLRAWQA